MAIFSHEGQFIDIKPEAAVSAGDFYAIGPMWGVAPYDIAAGADGVVQTSGVFKAVLKSGDTVAIGDALYIDGTAGVTASASASGSGSGSGSGLTPVGIALAAVTGDGTLTVPFKLNA